MQKCQECGLIHPQTPRGKCLVAAADKLKGSERGNRIVKFISKLSKFLQESDDYESDINKIEKSLGMC